MAYQPKVYRTAGGDEQVVASGGKITVESGGEIDIQAGSKITEPVVTKTLDYAVLAADSGMTFLIATDAKTFSLPATAAGLRYRFINTGGDGNNIITISPVTADSIMGGALSSVANKDLINTKSTAKEGDFVELLGDGGQGWTIVAIQGTWAKE